MYFFPNFVGKFPFPVVFFTVEVKADEEKQLALFFFPQFFDRGPDIHGKYADWISSGTLVQQIPGVVKIEGIRSVLNSNGI